MESALFPARHGIEWLIPAAFAVVNAAVFQVLSLTRAPDGSMAARDETSGATSYYLAFATGERATLFVLQRDDQLTSIEVHPFIRSHAEATISLRTMIDLGALIDDCYAETQRVVRYKHPTYGWFPIEGLTPPMPRYKEYTTSQEGWAYVFHWQGIYARGWSDEYLAKQQRVAVQTVANQRNKLNASRRKLEQEMSKLLGKTSMKK